MNKLVLILAFIVLPTFSFAGEWIAVDGGITEIKLDEKAVEDKLWAYLDTFSNLELEDRDLYSYQHQVKEPNQLYINAFCDSFDRCNLNKEF